MYAHPSFHQFAVFACLGGTADQGGTNGSFCNLVEADAVVNQVTGLIQNWPAKWGSVDASQLFVVSSEERQVCDRDGNKGGKHLLNVFVQLQAIEALLKSRTSPEDKAPLSQVRVGTPWELQGNRISLVYHIAIHVCDLL